MEKPQTTSFFLRPDTAGNATTRQATRQATPPRGRQRGRQHRNAAGNAATIKKGAASGRATPRPPFCISFFIVASLPAALPAAFLCCLPRCLPRGGVACRVACRVVALPAASDRQKSELFVVVHIKQLFKFEKIEKCDCCHSISLFSVKYRKATAPSFSLQCLLDGSSNLAQGYNF